MHLTSGCRALGFGFTLNPTQTLVRVCGVPQVEAEEPGTAYLAGQGPQIEDEDDPDEYEGEDQPESEDFEEGEEEAGAGNTPAGAPPAPPLVP